MLIIYSAIPLLNLKLVIVKILAIVCVFLFVCLFVLLFLKIFVYPLGPCSH